MKNSHFPLTWFTGSFLVLILLHSAPVFSQEKTLDKMLLDITQKSVETAAITCDFKQVRTLALFNKPIVFHGKLALIRPNKLRWEFTTPVPSILIFNDDKGLRCNENSEPTTFDLASDPVMRMVAEQLWTWLAGDYSKLKADYTLEKSGESSILVTPLDSQTANIIQNISIDFDENNMQPQSVLVREPGGDETSITFSAYKLNPVIPQSTFTHCFLRD